MALCLTYYLIIFFLKLKSVKLSISPNYHQQLKKFLELALTSVKERKKAWSAVHLLKLQIYI